MNNLLDYLDHNGVSSIQEMALALKTTPAMIQARLERYQQLGYVKKITISSGPGGCGGHCCRCGSCAGCGVKTQGGNPIVFWERVAIKE